MVDKQKLPIDNKKKKKKLLTWPIIQDLYMTE